MTDLTGGGVGFEEGQAQVGRSQALPDQRGISLKATATRKRWQQRKRVETQRTIRDTAMRLFEQHGYATVTVRRIADEAGVSTITLFRYFPAKEDLVFAMPLDGGLFDVLRRELSVPGVSVGDTARRVASAMFGAISQTQANGLMAWLRVVRSDDALTAALYAHVPRWSEEIIRTATMTGGNVRVDRRSDRAKRSSGTDTDFTLRASVTLVVVGVIETLLEWSRRCDGADEADLGLLLSIASDVCSVI